MACIDKQVFGKHGGAQVVVVVKMDVIYSDELPYGFSFEVNGVLVKGTKKEEVEKKAV